MVLHGAIAQLLKTQRPMPPDEQPSLYLLAAFARCFDFHTSIVLLARHDLAHPIAACLRSLLEQSWVFRYVIESKDVALGRLVQKHRETRRKNLQDFTDAFLEKEVEEEQQKLDDLLKGKAKIQIADWAKSKPWNKELCLYSSLCNATHPSLDAAEDYLVLENDKCVGYTCKGGDSRIPFYLASADYLMLLLVSACPDIWPEEERSQVLAHGTRVLTSFETLARQS